MPVAFSKRGDPLLEVEIEGKSYIFQLDSGSGSYLSIKNEILDNIQNKTQLMAETIYDFRGDEYVLQQFLISSVKIGKSRISNFPAIEESMDFLLTGSAWTPSKMSDAMKAELHSWGGRIGAPLLRAFQYWLFDFPHSQLVFIKDLNKFHDIFEFTEVDLENVQPHIVISVDTEFGRKTFLLDTGSNLSILRTPLDAPKDSDAFIFDRFEINGRDFGNMKFRLFDMTPRLQFDGILGVDFFMKYPIYFDFPKNKAYIGPENSL